VNVLRVDPVERGLRGRLRAPGDKSVSHRALLLAALAPGRSWLHGLSTGHDVVHTAAAIAQFGAGVERQQDGADDGGGAAVAVDGGPALLREPVGVIDVGNSGTGIRLLAGWAAAQPGLTILAGDDSIAARPMRRVAEPLRLMGAHIDGRHDGALPPLVVRGGALQGIDYRPPVASAQVKGAILLAGLAAAGETTVRETVPTRLHSEELLAVFGADITLAPGAVTVRASALSPAQLTVPADPSQAAFWAVAATIVPDSDLVLPQVYVGPGRAGFIDVLRRMGADIALVDEDPQTRTADLRIRSAPLVATAVGGDEVPSLIDEIPVLAVAAAYAEGTTTFADAAELRVKETDRIATTVAALVAIGVGAEGHPDGLSVHGGAGRRPRGGPVEAGGDHRIAMAFAVAALSAAGPVTIRGWDAVATSYPGFEEDLRRCVS
jgi:3-phosphoshikimate 1-carboxyvinyltransferase